MITINEQVFLFLTCVQTGVMMGMLYDLIRIFRKIIQHPNWMVQIEDLLYWVTCGCFAFIMLYWENYGQIRVFVFAGILIGSVLYFLTFSILFMKVATWVIFWIKKIINQLIQFVLIPIKCIIRILDIPYRYTCRAYGTLNKYKQIQVGKVKIKGRKYKVRLCNQWNSAKEKHKREKDKREKIKHNR